MERSVSWAELDAQDVDMSSPESVAVDDLKTMEEFDFVQPLGQEQPDEDEEALAFQLFAPSKNATVQTIKLRSPTPEIKEAGFVVAKRDPKYYFTSSDATFEKAAVTAADIQQLARIKWTGSAQQWKVLSVEHSQVTRAAREGLQLWSKLATIEPKKRTRPGKKYRIRLRMKSTAAKVKAEQARLKDLENKAAQQAREAADREKKTQRNREKKAKKRQREKVKKAAVRAGDDHDSDGSAG